MQETLSLTTIGTEVFSTVVIGGSNRSPDVDLSAMVPGDEVKIILYRDIVGIDNRKISTNVSVTYADLQSAGEEVVSIEPFSLEDSQTAVIGLTLISGATPLSVPMKNTNLATST